MASGVNRSASVASVSAFTVATLLTPRRDAGELRPWRFWFGSRAAPDQPRTGRIGVLDHDVGALAWLRRGEIQPLARRVPGMEPALYLRVGRDGVPVAHRHPAESLLESDVEEDD